jgi:hypothetical protein
MGPTYNLFIVKVFSFFLFSGFHWWTFVFFFFNYYNGSPSHYNNFVVDRFVRIKKKISQTESKRYNDFATLDLHFVTNIMMRAHSGEKIESDDSNGSCQHGIDFFFTINKWSCHIYRIVHFLFVFSRRHKSCQQIVNWSFLFIFSIKV